MVITGIEQVRNTFNSEECSDWNADVVKVVVATVHRGPALDGGLVPVFASDKRVRILLQRAAGSKGQNGHDHVYKYPFH